VLDVGVAFAVDGVSGCVVELAVKMDESALFCWGVTLRGVEASK